MKQFIAVAAAGALVVLVGCNEGTPGGPGVTERAVDEQPTYDPASPMATNEVAVSESDRTFTLDTPMMGTSLAPGESADLAIGIDRGRNMNQNIAIEFDGLPVGVTVVPETPQIAPDQSETNVSISASPTTPAGDYTVNVTGRPETGATAQTQMDITIEEQ